MSQEFEFEALFDDELTSFADNAVVTIGNERLLSIVSDFEEGEWKYKKFSQFIRNSAKETALAAEELSALLIGCSE